MIFLGVNVSHNASACLMVDGEIKLVGQEERFTNEKNFTGYPKKAINFCLDYVRKQNKKVDIAAFSTIWNPVFSFKIPLQHFFTVKDYQDFYGEKFYTKKFKNISTENYIKKLLRDKRNNLNLYLPYKKFKFKDLFAHSTKFNKLQVDYLSKHSKGLIKKIVNIDHHTCHAYYAYYAPQKIDSNCAAITLDSMGDDCNQTVWIPNKNGTGITKIASSNQCELARVYKFVTLILSILPNEQEYKVMGLAPYAKKKYAQKLYEKVFKNLLQLKNFKIIHKNRPKDLFSFLKKELSSYRFDNIAGALQIFVETFASKLVTEVYKKYNIRNFSISGGVALNVKMNKVLSELNFVKQLYVPPSGADESLSIGACYYLSKSSSKFLKNIYLGQSIDKNLTYNNISKYFNSSKYRLFNNFTHESLAKLLSKGEIIAVARGKEEFGARALGNRSIIADPSKPDLVQEINEYIKNRDFWMPFALTILEDKHKQFIKNDKNLRSDFMTIGFDTLMNKYNKIKAGTHAYDKTVRPQILNKSYNEKFYSIIKKFEKITGIPALLNTSLNLHGLPIASNLKNVIYTFKNSGLKYLYLNDKYLIKKV